MELHYNNKSVRHAVVERFFVTVVLLAALAGCHRPEPIALQGEAQGTFYSILYIDPQGRNLKGAIDSLLADFDLTASLWVDSSMIRRVNRNETTVVSRRFADLLEKSMEMNRYTDGAFDCRIGRLVQLWGFSFRQRQEPDDSALDSLLAAARGSVTVSHSTPPTISKQYPGTELDFNAIAQGYSSDLVARFLDSLGIHRYLVDIGGEVIAKGEKSPGRPWTVGIERPAEDSLSAPVVETAIRLEDASVVTSGSYRKYYEKNGTRYSHTIDPATGRPVGHTLLSVSVVEKECWLADAMATAYMVMGLNRARDFIGAHPDGPGTKAVMFIYDDHGKLRTYATPGWHQLVPKNQ